MIKRDVLRFYAGLGALADLGGSNTSFAYACAKTRRMIQPEVDALQDVAEPSQAFVQYNEARLELCRKHNLVADDGEPVIKKDLDGTSRFVMRDQRKFDKALEKLRNEHKPALDAQDKKDKEVEALLDEEAEVSLHLVSLDDVPAGITPGQLENIFEMISENEVG